MEKTILKVNRMRKFLPLLLCLMLCLPGLAENEKYDTLPPCQQVSQTEQRIYLSNGLSVTTARPRTVNEAVNAALETRLAALEARGREALPAKPVNPQEGAQLYVAPSVFRTGESWQSYLLLAEVFNGREQTYVDFDAATYDTATGEEITLDMMLADPAAYDLLREAARETLCAYFPAEEADPDVLSALLSGIENAPFTLNTAFLTLHFRADALYPGHHTLMHVRVPYTVLRPYMSARALSQTDNSRYKLIALTYDDGPTRGHTQYLVRALRRGNAGATFFIVGSRIRIGHDLISYEHDSLFSVGSHTYDHLYGQENKGKVIERRDKLFAELGSVIGAPVTLMRAPGGAEKIFIAEDARLPLFHWTLVSCDTGGKILDPANEARRLAGLAQDGDIVLSHDLYRGTAEVADTLPGLLNERGFLCVTIEELFACAGVTLEPNTVYMGARQ